MKKVQQSEFCVDIIIPLLKELWTLGLLYKVPVMSKDARNISHCFRVSK